MVASIVVLARTFAALLVLVGCGSGVAPVPAANDGVVVVEPPTSAPVEHDRPITATALGKPTLEFFDPRLDFLVDAGVDAHDIGFCTPTYFVYQLRLDGHPNPR